MNERLTPILQQLRASYENITENDRVKRVKQYLNELAYFYHYDRQTMYQRLRYSHQEYMSSNQTNKTKYQEQLTAYLVFTNLQRFGKYHEGKVDIKDQDERQIQAIIALLDGKHLQMGTGEGKSSTVLPITSLVEAMTSDKKAAILSSVNKKLVGDLREGLDYFTQQLQAVQSPDQPPIIRVVDQLSDQKSPEQIKTEEYLKKQKASLDRLMTVDIIRYRKFSKKTQQKIHDYYWEKKLLLAEFSNNKPTVIESVDGSPTVVLCQDHDLVFEYMNNREEFIKKAPTMFMDEAHVPYDRKTPYVISNPLELMTPDEISNNIFTWCTANLVNRYITNKELNNMVYGQRELNTDKQQWLTNGYWLPVTEKDQLFTKTVNQLAKQLKIDPLKIKGRLFDLLTTGYTKLTNPVQKNMENPTQFNLTWIIDHIAQLRMELGKIYEADGAVRDSYLGVLLEGHKFSPNEQIIINALLNKFALVSTTDSYQGLTHYETFIYDLASRIKAVSGTLKMVDSQTRKVLESPFGKLLKSITHQDVFVSQPREFKTVPLPFLSKNDDYTLKIMIENINKDSIQPTLIACFNENDATKLQNKLKHSNSKLRIGRIDSFTTDSDEAKIYKLLANGQLDCVITAGRAAVGVDIKNDQNQHPDLRIIMYGMPQSRLQVMQILGRRRAKGDNSFWYISRYQVEETLAQVPSNDNIISRLFDSQTFKKLYQYFESIGASYNDEHLKTTVWNLLRKFEASHQSNIDQKITFDHFFTNSILPYAKERLKSYLESSGMSKDDIKDFEHSYTPVNLYNLIYHQTTLINQLITNIIEQNKDKTDFEQYLPTDISSKIPTDFQYITNLVNGQIDQFAEELLANHNFLKPITEKTSPLSFIGWLQELPNNLINKDIINSTLLKMERIKTTISQQLHTESILNIPFNMRQFLKIPKGVALYSFFYPDKKIVRQKLPEGFEYGYIQFENDQYLSCKITSKDEGQNSRIFLITNGDINNPGFYLYNPGMRIKIKIIKQLDKTIFFVAK